MSIGKSVIRPLKDALDDMPVHIRQLAEMFRKHAQKQRRNNDGIADVDKFDGVHTVRGDNIKTTIFDPKTNRPISERGHIREDFGSSHRGDNATEIGRTGRSGDDGGHLGGHRFFGDTPDQGIAPQAANLNRGAWRKMENEWADWVATGRHVDYEIRVYPPGSTRPDKFEVEYTVTDPATGKQMTFTPVFDNEPDQVFDRIYKKDMQGK
ncbi:MAG: hypothetical protein ABS63_09625 [Microbacterium sp. SCN 70-27]|uniref:DNA/RNA non-specific endonuclease n=1 Tax=unclassified Microbacterium TaxID=2609290 RepID=UPI00086B9727|nr:MULTISPECIES: DNA/RNA non-specific endonuclease [unclassified Microbacterium]MBN9224556.1 DNA/RNA non-specific endonuclease [Microbacterium sp.]ODT27129.1 MAG: hypothetical protein ABS63_09625 [Microbacterium sp. SCN 70-27]